MISSGIQEEIVMATITAGEFRNGKVFEMEGKYYQVVEFQHVKPGKGAAFVRTKMKNVVTGGVTETSFNPTAKFEEVAIERKNMEYSYNDGDLYYFMDQETYDMSSASSPPTSLTLRSPRPSRVWLATPRPTPSSPQRSRPARRSRCRCSSTSATRSRSTPARASISAAPSNRH